jgi:hypothetical protein
MQLRSALFAMCTLACTTLANPASADGKLSRARDEASGRSSSSSRSSDTSSSSSNSFSSSTFDDHRSSHSHRHKRHHHHADPCAHPTGIDAASCGYPSTYIGEVEYVPMNLLPQPTYSSYPYETSRSPYLLDPELQVASTSASLDAHLRAEHTAGQAFAGQLSLDAGFLAGVGRSNLSMRVLMPGPLEVSARNAVLWEPAANDYSLFGALAIEARVAQSRFAFLRLFAGFAYFGQIREMLTGGEVGVSMEVFLGRPWVLTASASAAYVGEVLAPQARLQLGYLFGRSEVFVAYQYLQIGSVDLSAPLLGTRIWL